MFVFPEISDKYDFKFKVIITYKLQNPTTGYYVSNLPTIKGQCRTLRVLINCNFLFCEKFLVRTGSLER
jgi:hypothetical protein